MSTKCCSATSVPSPAGKLKTVSGSYEESIKLARKALLLALPVVWGDEAACLNKNIPGGLVNEQ